MSWNIKYNVLMTFCVIVFLACLGFGIGVWFSPSLSIFTKSVYSAWLIINAVMFGGWSLFLFRFR